MSNDTVPNANKILPKSVELTDYPQLDLPKFRNLTEKLTQLGFEFLKDYVDEADEKEVITRLMVLRERRIYGLIRQPRWGDRTSVEVSYVSHFKNGKAIVTTSGQDKVPVRTDTESLCEVFSTDNTLDKLLRSHQALLSSKEWGELRSAGLLNYFIYYTVEKWS